MEAAIDTVCVSCTSETNGIHTQGLGNLVVHEVSLLFGNFVWHVTKRVGLEARAVRLVVRQKRASEPVDDAVAVATVVRPVTGELYRLHCIDLYDSGQCAQRVASCVSSSAGSVRAQKVPPAQHVRLLKMPPRTSQLRRWSSCPSCLRDPHEGPHGIVIVKCWRSLQRKASQPRW